MQTDLPQKNGMEKMMKDAFGYWAGTLRFQIFFSVIYCFFLYMVFHFFVQTGLFDEYFALMKSGAASAELRMAAQKLAANPQMTKLSWVLLAALVFLYPLNIGFYKIYRMIDLGEKPEAKDLFAGYSGTNFIIYTSYYLFWMMIFSYAIQTVFLGIIWIFITLFTAPLMFFAGKRSLETIPLNISAIRRFFPEVVAGVFVAFMFRYFGLALFFFGFLFTFPFYNAMIYAMYKKIFSEEKKV